MNMLVSGSIGTVRRLALAPIPLPKLVECWREGYSPRLLAADLIAGVTVGLVALPLAMAFAIASGLPPETGLYCGAIAGFTISALGGSRVQIGGPTGAFVVIVYGIVQKYGVDGLTVATLMAGVLLIALGAARMGAAIKFVQGQLNKAGPAADSQTGKVLFRQVPSGVTGDSSTASTCLPPP